MAVPAGIYLRISRDSERLGLGVKRQRVDCEKLVKRLGWEVAGFYEDNDVSATNGKPRPAYTRMMQDVERGLIQAVIAAAAKESELTTQAAENTRGMLTGMFNSLGIEATITEGALEE